MAIDPARLVLALFAGALTGAGYFGGLYLTVRRVGKSSAPGWLLLISFLVRLVAVLVVFYLLSAWGPAAMLVALGAFLLARMAWFKGVRGRRSAIGPGCGERRT